MPIIFIGLPVSCVCVSVDFEYKINDTENCQKAAERSSTKHLIDAHFESEMLLALFIILLSVHNI